MPAASSSLGSGEDGAVFTGPFFVFLSKDLKPEASVWSIMAENRMEKDEN